MVSDLYFSFAFLNPFIPLLVTIPQFSSGRLLYSWLYVHVLHSNGVVSISSFRDGERDTARVIRQLSYSSCSDWLGNGHTIHWNQWGVLRKLLEDLRKNSIWLVFCSRLVTMNEIRGRLRVKPTWGQVEADNGKRDIDFWCHLELSVTSYQGIRASFVGVCPVQVHRAPCSEGWVAWLNASLLPWKNAFYPWTCVL